MHYALNVRVGLDVREHAFYIKRMVGVTVDVRYAWDPTLDILPNVEFRMYIA